MISFKLKTLVITILFILSAPIFAYEQECQQSRNQSDKCKLSRAEVLTDIYDQVTLKVAGFLAEENIPSLEDYARILSRNLSDEEKSSAKKEFSKYAQAEQFEGFLKSIANASYWDKEKRLSNNSAALVILLMNKKYSLGLTEDEIEMIWFMQNVNHLMEKERGKFSYEYNIYNLTNQLIKLTGAMKGSQAISVAEAQKLINRVSLMNCFDAYSDFINRDLFWEILSDEERLSVSGGKVLLDGEALFEPSELEMIVGNKKGVFKDNRDQIDQDLSFKEYFELKSELNKKENLDIIQGYHKHISDEDYAVIDKKTQEIIVYNRDGFELERSPIHIGHSDKMANAGAGVYEVSDGEGLVLTSEKEQRVKSYTSSIRLPAGSKVYILPNEKSSKFFIKNYKLNFVSTQKREHYNAYNFSSRDKKIIDTDFSTEDDDDFKQQYLGALSDEKEDLMKLYNLDSETYNKLALFSYGVLAPETKFGDDPKYLIKEFAPILVSLAKGNGFRTQQNSRGPTQIKRIPKKIIEEYGIDKSDLSHPRNAAIATLGFSAELLQELKAISHHHGDIDNDNIYDYLYYLYNGKRHEIKRATATPHLNIAIKRIHEAIKEVKVTDSIR